jgi:hypothetical protein
LYHTLVMGGRMRKLVFILIAFIAAITFIRAYDNSNSDSSNLSGTIVAPGWLP